MPSGVANINQSKKKKNDALPVDFFLQVLLCKDYLQYVQKQGLQNCSLNQFE